jgi:hypothetical protein
MRCCASAGLLSNDDVLAFSSTDQFSLFLSTLPKVCMHVIALDCGEGEAGRETAAGFHRLVVWRMSGDDGFEFPLLKSVNCRRPVETWLAQLIDGMRETVRENILSAVNSCPTARFAEWAVRYQPFIAVTALNVRFTEEMDDVIGEKNASEEAFQQCKGVWSGRIKELTEGLVNTKGRDEIIKLSAVLVHAIRIRDRLMIRAEKPANHSRKVTWDNSLKFKLLDGDGQIQVEHADTNWEYGDKYWGKVSTLIHPATTEASRAALLSSFCAQSFRVLEASSGSGRRQTIANLACEHFSQSHFGGGSFVPDEGADNDLQRLSPFPGPHSPAKQTL